MINQKDNYRYKQRAQRTDNLFDKELREIIGERYSKGLDSKPVGRRIIQRKIIRSPFWVEMKNQLKVSKFVKEDDGQMIAFNWFNVMIVSFMAVIFFAGLIYVMGLLNTSLHDAGALNEVNSGQPGYTNLTYAADVTFGQVNQSIQALRMVALTLIFSLFLATMLINFAIKIHPAYFFVYILIVIFGIILAAPISNAYQELLVSGIFGGILPSFTGSNWILINLPAFVAFFGILGGIFLFINIINGPAGGEIR